MQRHEIADCRSTLDPLRDRYLPEQRLLLLAFESFQLQQVVIPGKEIAIQGRHYVGALRRGIVLLPNVTFGFWWLPIEQ